LKINNREIYWGYADPPEDFAGFEVRYHNQASKTSWVDAIKAHRGYLSATHMFTNLVPNSARSLLVCAVDDFGVYSTNPVTIFRDAITDYANNAVFSVNYHDPSPSWAGTKVDCSVNGSDELVSDDTGGDMYSGDTNALMYDGAGMYESTYAEMYYYDDLITSVAGEAIVTLDFDGSGFEISIRDDIYDTWRPLPNRQYLDIGSYEIRLRVYGGRTRGVVRAFTISIDAVDITEDVIDLTVTGQTRVPIAQTYSQITIVSVIIQDDGVNTPIGYRILDKDVALGPLIELYDATGAGSDGLVDVIIRGY
jgi:hypothetical protein